MEEESRKSPGRPVKVTVVDRRHHASDDQPVEPRERSPYPSFIEELKARVEEAERRAREAADLAEREIDAVRERLQRDIGRRVDEGSARVLGSILEVVDNLDRAYGVAAAESEAIARGIDLIRAQVLGILENEGVAPIETVGLDYDPNVAEAVMLEPVDAARHNLVIEEVQRGYRLKDMVLRAAKVKVGKADPGTGPAE